MVLLHFSGRCPVILLLALALLVLNECSTPRVGGSLDPLGSSTMDNVSIDA